MSEQMIKNFFATLEAKNVVYLYCKRHTISHRKLKRKFNLLMSPEGYVIKTEKLTELEQVDHVKAVFFDCIVVNQITKQ